MRKIKIMLIIVRIYFYTILTRITDKMSRWFLGKWSMAMKDARELL